jgi:hypothetical protein
MRGRCCGRGFNHFRRGRHCGNWRRCSFRCCGLCRCGCLPDSAWLCGAGSRCCGRFDHYRSRRNNRHDRPSRYSARRCFGHHGSGRRLGCDGWCRLRNDGRRRAGLWHNLSRLWTGGGRRRSGNGDNWRRCLGWILGRSGSGRARRRASSACRRFIFLLFGQNGLHHVAGLRDVGQINFWCDGLGAAT